INRASSAAVNDNSVVLKEDYEPTTLVGGKKAKKEVSVTNTGNEDVFIRISYEEVLKHLTNKGETKYDDLTTHPTAKYDPDETTLGKDAPIIFDMAQATKDGFVEVPAAQITGLDATADENVKLFVKGSRQVDPYNSTKFTHSMEYRLVHEYTAGEYQAMSCSANPTDFATNTSDQAKDWNYTLSDVKYGYYAKGYTHKVVNWAKSSVAPQGETTVTGRALIGTAGSRYGVSYNYKAEADGFGVGFDLSATAIPVKPAAAIPQVPIESGKQYDVQADTDGLETSAIAIEYGPSMVTPTTLDANKWVYNSDDGWFYYTSKLSSGQTTDLLMKNLVFKGAMGKEYTNASYDLGLKMEAIAANKEALTDSAGWGMTTSQTNTGLIHTFLTTPPTPPGP
ncbi:hypothetical protein JZO70_20420, partial [Enterococcus sp. 669A]